MLGGPEWGMMGCREASLTVGIWWIDGLWSKVCRNIWENTLGADGSPSALSSSLRGRLRREGWTLFQPRSMEPRSGDPMLEMIDREPRPLALAGTGATFIW
jgi:hypothetical protein